MDNGVSASKEGRYLYRKVFRITKRENKAKKARSKYRKMLEKERLRAKSVVSIKGFTTGGERKQ